MQAANFANAIIGVVCKPDLVRKLLVKLLLIGLGQRTILLAFKIFMYSILGTKNMKNYEMLNWQKFCWKGQVKGQNTTNETIVCKTFADSYRAKRNYFANPIHFLFDSRDQINQKPTNVATAKLLLEGNTSSEASLKSFCKDVLTLNQFCWLCQNKINN